MSFLGTYADLHDYRIAGFTIDSLIGRDKTGAPVWRVSCGQCLSHQAINHARLAHLVEVKASQRSLLCNNPACPLARHEHPSESLADLRQKERAEAAEQARAAVEAERLAAIEADKQRAKDAKVAALKREYLKYFNHQMRTSLKQSQIPSWQRWQELSQGTRNMLIDMISKDASLEITGL